MKNNLFKYLLIVMFATFIVLGVSDLESKDDKVGKDANHEKIVQFGMGKLENYVANGIYSVEIKDVSYSSEHKGTVVKFTIIKNNSYLSSKPDQLSVIGGTYNADNEIFPESFEFNDANYDSENGVWVAKSIDDVNLTTKNAFVYIYSADEQLDVKSAGRITLYRYVDNVGKKFGNWEYSTTANVDGCIKCHGDPYLKHGYRGAVADGLEDFVACKSCHYDNREGEHYIWQVLADDIELAIAAEKQNDPEAYIVSKTEDKYAYKANIMNDVHMSHSMEFAYPQTFKNCVTCHEGKLDKVLTDENFTLETCKSCHPVDGYELGSIPDHLGEVSEIGTKQYALNTIIPHQMFNQACNNCHKNGGIATTFDEIHSGYNEIVYYKNASGEYVKYSDAITVTVDDLIFDPDKMTIIVNFSASSSDANLDVSTMNAVVLLGFYGYDTKDFLLGGHKFEVAVGTPNNNNKWSYTFDMFSYTSDGDPVGQEFIDNFRAGYIKRAEVAIMPTYRNNNGEVVALNSPSRTFNLFDKAFEDFSTTNEIVEVEKCNACHEALATEFHSPDRAGNIQTCRICHEPTNGAFHLEAQSRSLDSYVHAIHSMQYLDADKVKPSTFNNASLYNSYAYEAHKLKMELHKDEVYPMFTTLNCESCHKQGTYGLPNQSKSLPGILSESKDAVATGYNIPEAFTGPASRACGACHRSSAINEGEYSKVVTLNSHADNYGYFIPGGNFYSLLPTTFVAGGAENESCSTCHSNAAIEHQGIYNNFAVNAKQ